MITTLTPTWQVDACVRGFTTLRKGGVSTGPYASLNLGIHVGDKSAAVHQNRARVIEQLDVPTDIHWLQQVHGTRVVRVNQSPESIPQADASYTQSARQVLAIMTADCLPLFIANQEGTEIALLHCGWRSVANGIIEQTLNAFYTPGKQLHAWLGPSIGPTAFEVGDDVQHAMLGLQPEHEAFFAIHGKRWLLDLPALITAELMRHGLRHITASDRCTYNESECFFSYRRDGQTGRMASYLWIES